MISIYTLPIGMIICLTLTVIIEIVLAIVFGLREKKDIINVILVNFITNPIVSTVPFFFNIFYGLYYRNIVLFILEILTVIIEGFVYNKYLSFKKINPYMLSLLLNVGSYFIGNIINSIIY